jgi:hypothetical protein
MSLGLVLAGTGDLEALTLIRALRAKVDAEVRSKRHSEYSFLPSLSFFLSFDSFGMRDFILLYSHHLCAFSTLW